MKTNDMLKRNQSWVQYAVIVLLFSVGVIFLSVFSFNSYAKLAREDVARAVMNSVEADAELLNNTLNEGRNRLEIICRLTEYILHENLPVVEVDSLFVTETLRYNAETGSNFLGVYGLVRNQYIDGGRWVPDSNYVPQKRPWYKKAVQSLNGEIQVMILQDMSTGSRHVAMSKVLSDKQSVIALDMSLSNIRKSFVNRQDGKNHWMVLNSHGEVVDHHEANQIGENYLSNKYWGSEEEKLARRILQASSNQINVDFGGKEFEVFISPVDNKWFVVKMVDEATLTEGVRLVTAHNMMVAALLLLLIVFLFTYGFIKHRKMSRMLRIKSFIRAKMDHEMHASINGILGMNSVVAKSIRDENVRTFSEGVQAAVQGLSSLINDVKEVVEADVKSVESASSGYGLFEVLSDCYRTVLPKAAIKKLQVSFECNPDIPSSLWGDARIIRLIVNNLLADAVKRTESGSISVSVGGDSVPKLPGSIEERIVLKFSIRDTGAGVDVEKTERLESWMNASAELCIARLMIETCKGEFVVKSRFGEGTTFMVSIPQVVLNNEPMGDFESRFNSMISNEQKKAETLFAPSARVLVVDDVDMNLKVVCGLLKDTKAQIDTAINAAQCLELVAIKHYDLILLDYSLPMMNGVETFEKMKKMENSPNKMTPVIMATAESVEFKDSFLKIGLADYIVKPYQEKDLLRMLAWYLPKELVLTQEDLLEFPQRIQKPAPKKEETPADDEIVLHSILTPEEKLKVFNGVLNVRAGLEYFSHDVRCYYEILQEFVREDKRHGFDKTFQMKDWNNYLILIHSVSSVAQAIGAEKLALQSQEVERACKDYKFDLIADLHPSFMVTYTGTMESILKGLVEYEN